MQNRSEINEDVVITDEVVTRYYNRLIRDALTEMPVADVRSLVMEMESIIARHPSD